MEIKMYALFCNGKLLNEDGYYCKMKDVPAFARAKSAFDWREVKENGWDIVPVTVIVPELPN